MASPHVSVIVKTLAGELLALSLDPATGLDGVAAALSKEFPEEYPQDITSVIYADPSAQALVDGVLLIALVAPLIMTSLVSTEQIILPGSNNSYDESFIHFHFALHNGTPFHVYHLLAHNPYIAFSTKPLSTVTRKYKFFGTIHNALKYHCLTHQDAHLVAAIVHKFVPQHLLLPPAHDKQLLTYCECGHLVEHSKMRAHLATKLKHPHGDPEGLKFLAAAQAYIDSL